MDLASASRLCCTDLVRIIQFYSDNNLFLFYTDTVQDTSSLGRSSDFVC